MTVLRLSTALAMRFWWHTKAYGTVLIIGLLTLISVIFLQVYWSCRSLLQLVAHQEIGDREWKTVSRK
ncbi:MULTISPECIES: hypothetical protein [Nostocales]|uniref:Uncharacterized protein n=3 Tax=Nostocales TaxID=1161 RepID=A0A8S9TCV7_9CYAN|nr:hypothetical protein [Tolypothrix bouteillei]KAF3889948.1 hypothetical protein DA73_0400034130 [Tolypothrix bouteillei VB521301]